MKNNCKRKSNPTLALCVMNVWNPDNKDWVCGTGGEPGLTEPIGSQGVIGKAGAARGN